MEDLTFLTRFLGQYSSTIDFPNLAHHKILLLSWLSNYLINIYCSLSEQKVEKVISEFEGKNFSYLKDNLSDLIIEKICPIGNEIKKLLKDKKYLLGVLKDGNQRANSIAKIKLREIYDKIGFLNLI